MFKTRRVQIIKLEFWAESNEGSLNFEMLSEFECSLSF